MRRDLWNRLAGIFILFMLGSLCTEVSAKPPPGEMSCRQSVGAKQAQTYAAQCVMVSPATHPPCNAENSCKDILAEVKRGCGFLYHKPGDPPPAPGTEAPAFCKKYGSPVRPPFGSEQPFCDKVAFSEYPKDTEAYSLATVQGADHAVVQAEPRQCKPNDQACLTKRYLVPGDEVVTVHTWSDYVCVLYPKSGTMGWVNKARLIPKAAHP